MRALVWIMLLLGPTVVLAGPEGGDSKAKGLDGELRTLCELRARGENDRALALANRLVQGYPDSLDAHVAYQDLQIARGDTRSIRARYAGRAGRSTASADDIYLHARLLEGRKAVKAYKRALRADPGHFGALCGLGAVYISEGKAREAQKLLVRARRADPKSPIPVNSLGWLAEGQGDVEQAERFYRKAAGLGPSFSLPRTNLGILLIGQRRFQEAETALKDARQIAPADPMPLMGLGLVKAATGDLQGALNHYQLAVELKTNTLASLNLLGAAYMGLEQFDLANQAFRKALRARPKDITTLLNLSYLAFRQGQPVEGQQWAEKALAIDAKSSQAHYFSGLCLEWNGKAKQAEKSYRRAADLDPEDANYPRALGALFADLGKWKEAVKAYSTAVELSDGSPQSMIDLAFAYVGAGISKKAVRCFEDVVELDPDNLTAWMNIGLLYQEKLRNSKKAVNAYAEYLNRGGTDPRVKKWLEEAKK